METIFIGIDPGQSGGIACAVGGDVRAIKMPETERDVLEFLRNCTTLSDGECVAVLEKSQPFPHAAPGGEGGAKRGAISSWASGKNYGMLRMALTAAGISFNEARPQQWQKALGCMSRGDKNITKRRAQDLFPHVVVTHAIADALLLMEYCKRIKLGQLQADPQPLLPKKTRAKKRREHGLF